jgi:hypothetical protein
MKNCQKNFSTLLIEAFAKNDKKSFETLKKDTLSILSIIGILRLKKNIRDLLLN